MLFSSSGDAEFRQPSVESLATGVGEAEAILLSLHEAELLQPRDRALVQVAHEGPERRAVKLATHARKPVRAAENESQRWRARAGSYGDPARAAPSFVSGPRRT